MKRGNMKNWKSIGYILTFIGCVGIGHSSFAASALPVFVKSLEKGCPKKEFKTQYSFQSESHLLEKTYTGVGPRSSCQAFVGFQMAQYYALQQGGHDSVLPESIPADCCEGFRQDNQSTFAFLQRLKKQNLGCFSVNRLSSSSQNGDNCTHFKDSIGKAVKDGFESNSACSTSPSASATSLSYKKLPLFNVEFLETLSPAKNIERMREHFKAPPAPLSAPLPVGLSFCAQERAPRKLCSADHSVLVTGVRKACCGRTCQEEWQIRSFPGAGPNGWTGALPLARSSAEFHGGVTQISPCQNQVYTKGSTESQCNGIVQGQYPLHYLAKTGDFDGMKTAFQALKKKVNEFDNSDFTPLSLAAIGSTQDHVKVVEFLLQNKADPNLEDASSMTPLHWALLNRAAVAPRMVQLLVQKGASFLSSDGNFTSKIRDLSGKGNPASRDVLERKRKEYFLNLH